MRPFVVGKYTTLVGSNQEKADQHNLLVADGFSTVDFLDPIPAGYIVSGGLLILAPSSISAVSSWFRLASPNTTIAGLGYNRVEDVLDPTSPATQTTDGLRPVPSTSTNGLPTITASAHVLSVPITTARDGTTSWGFWGHFRRTGGTFPARFSMRALSGASADKITNTTFPNLTGLYAQVLNGAGADSVAEVVAGSVLNAWQFETYEFNGSVSGDANRLVITKDGVVQTVTFTGAAMPASMASVTGTIALMAEQLNGSNPFVGQVGPNFGFLGAPMAGVTAGILTPAARQILSNFERPT